MNQKEKTTKFVFAGLFAALVFVTTWTIHFPVGVNGGYIHFGDSIVYLSTAILPLPYAMAASAIGAGLSDLLSPGGAVWILPTMIIKPLCCLAFTRKSDNIICRRNVIGVFLGGAITIVGYFLASAFLTGGFLVPIAELPFSFVQPTGSAICFLVWGLALDKAHIKNVLPLHLQERRQNL